MNTILPIHPLPRDGHLGCIQISVCTCNAAVNTSDVSPVELVKNFFISRIQLLGRRLYTCYSENCVGECSVSVDFQLVSPLYSRPHTPTSTWCAWVQTGQLHYRITCSFLLGLERSSQKAVWYWGAGWKRWEVLCFLRRLFNQFSNF